MARPHIHSCVNRRHGCKGSYECSLPPERDEDGTKFCSGDNPDDHLECEDCENSRCSACGSVLNIEPHDSDCEKATEV
jgi:hypothetical protein